MRVSSQPIHPTIRITHGITAELRIGTELRTSRQRSAAVSCAPCRTLCPTASAKMCATNVDSVVPTTIAIPTCFSSAGTGTSAASTRMLP